MKPGQWRAPRSAGEPHMPQKHVSPGGGSTGSLRFVHTQKQVPQGGPEGGAGNAWRSSRG